MWTPWCCWSLLLHAVHCSFLLVLHRSPHYSTKFQEVARCPFDRCFIPRMHTSHGTSSTVNVHFAFGGFTHTQFFYSVRNSYFFLCNHWHCTRLSHSERNTALSRHSSLILSRFGRRTLAKYCFSRCYVSVLSHCLDCSMIPLLFHFHLADMQFGNSVWHSLFFRSFNSCHRKTAPLSMNTSTTLWKYHLIHPQLHHFPLLSHFRQQSGRSTVYYRKL